jgi:ParB family transcriptional regulator, chromosome partitioning protein
MVSKSRLPDASTMPPDPILDGIASLRGGRDGRPVVPTSFIQRGNQDQVKSLQQRIDHLEAERSAGGVLLWLDPKIIGHSAEANRDQRNLSLDNPSFKRLYESIKANRQDDAIAIRTAPAGSPYKYEVVKGHRRHAVCLILDRETEGGYPIRCVLEDDAREGSVHFLKMFRENFEREGLSAYEQGRMFMSALASKKFDDAESMAAACQVSPATVSQYLSASNLPAEVLLSFGSPHVISLRWVQTINRALKGNRAAVLEASKSIATMDPPLPPQEVLKRLAEAGASQHDEPSREEAVKIDNKVVFRYKSGRDGPRIVYGKMVNRQVRKTLDQKIKALIEAEIREQWDR